MPVAAAVTYVLRSCSEPICAAITPPRVCDCSAFVHLSANAASWFGVLFVGGFYFPTTRAVALFNLLMMEEDCEGMNSQGGAGRNCC
jgi:hypothetical protein